MDSHAIAFSVPVFFLMIAVELLLVRRRPELRYRLHDSINSLSCGVGQQALALFFVAVEVGAYTLVWDRFRLTTIATSSPLAWLVLLFAVDLGYYAYHLASHRVNFFWAMHVVHHQSEEYNLTTALRQSWFTALTSWVFYVPLAVAGFPPSMFVAMHTFNTLYQFWIHTRLVGKLGPLEWVLNTPSHHRVHHGINPAYIDKNYAGVFIIWDRLFGTFAPETTEPVYGTVKPLASWNPLWANVEPWLKIMAVARDARRLRDKLWIWFAPPEWLPEELGGIQSIPEASRAAQRKYDAKAPRGVDGYAMVGFALVSAASSALMMKGQSLDAPSKALVVGAVLTALVGWGGLFERRAWAVPFEWARLGLTVALGAWLARGSAGFAGIVAAAAVAAIGLSIWVGRFRGEARVSGGAEGVSG